MKVWDPFLFGENRGSGRALSSYA